MLRSTRGCGSRDFVEQCLELGRVGYRCMACGFDAHQRLRLRGIKMRQGFTERGRERGCSERFGRDAQHRFAETIDFVRSFFERGGLRIAGRPKHDHL